MTAFGQQTDGRSDSERGINDYRPSRSAGYIFRPTPQPLEQLPSAPAGNILFSGDAITAESPVQALGEQAVLLRIGRIYRYQSEMMTAEAEGDKEQSERLLELAMTELNTLMQVPDIMDRPRFQELYRSVVTEYESRYGTEPENMGVEYGDIFQFRQDMFLAMNDVKQPLLEDVMLAQKIKPVGTQVHMTMNRLVEQSMAYLLREPNKHLYRWMSRADTYFPMVEQILKEEGVPDEIKYLAMIESGLNPQAQSWAQAVGMWQFIAETGRRYGLQVNSYVDERKDPEKATRAAARHLRDLYKTFGDWQLALAAYNCGAGNVTKAQRRLGRAGNFWEIYDYLPKETRGYVPMYVATALLVSNPNEFKLARVEPGPRYEYQTISLKSSAPLAKIADMAGTDVSTIRALNPAIRRNSTPPTGYSIRIPLGTFDRFLTAYNRTPQDEREEQADIEPAEEEYVVRRGDTMSKIARKYGVTTTQIKQANNLRSSVVRSGQRLVIPVPAQENASAPVLLADMRAVTVQYGTRNFFPIAAAGNMPDRTPQQPYRATSERTTDRTPITRASDSSTTRSAEPDRTSTKTTHNTRVIYKVRRGDTLSKVASKYGVSMDDVKKWNRLRRSTLLSGQRLTIYTNTNERGDLEPRSTTQTTSSRTTERENTTASTVNYTVRRGDTLKEIADKYGVTMSDIRKWNKLRSSNLMAGKRLKIYTNGAAPAEEVRKEETTAARDEEPARETESKASTHKVKRGENLASIAQKYGVSLSDLREWNDIKGNTLYAGQTLKLYGAKSSSTSETKSSGGKTITYKVKRGDNLAEIAKKYGVTISDIKEWNNLHSNNIRSGQRLRIKS